jgi:cell division protein FtsB
MHRLCSRVTAFLLARWQCAVWHQRYTAGAALVLASLAPTQSPAHADEPDALSRQQEVEQLRQEVQSLKEQVKSLQEAPAATSPQQTPPVARQSATLPPAEVQPTPNVTEPSVPTAVKPAADSIPALREKWSQVKQGMPKARITDVLGTPTKELTINGKLVWYYYYEGIGGSSVFFNSDGRVSSQQRPTVGWW